MRRKAAFPFQVLPDSIVKAGEWMLGGHGEPLAPVSDVLEGWDYARDLEVKLDVEIDMEAAADLLGIGAEELSLDAVIKAGTGAGTVPRQVNVLGKRAIQVNTSEFTLTGFIQSTGLSGRLYLECGILLAELGSHPGPITPVWKGARLWETSKDVLIEDGGASRFPIESVSFKSNFSGTPQEHAPWYIDWKPDRWHLDFGGSVRLYVNSDIPEVQERVVTGDPLTLQAILADTINQTISNVLSTPDCDELLQDCGQGSLGDQVRHWMDMAFPGQSSKAIAALRSHRPGRFQAAILSAADASE